MAATVKPPLWFWVIAVLLLLWAAMGCLAWYSQWTQGPAAWGPVDDWARTYYAALPGWYDYVYGVGTIGGLLGVVALLLCHRLAITLFWTSEIAVVVMFGYTFAATNLIAHKGAGTVAFPVVIAAIGAFEIWLASLAARRGWIG